MSDHPHGPEKLKTRPLGFYLSRSVFPATRGRLMCEARRAGAPPEVVRALRQLPEPPPRFPDLDSVRRHLGSS